MRVNSKRMQLVLKRFVQSVNKPPPFSLFISHPKPRTFKRKFKAWQLAKKSKMEITVLLQYLFKSNLWLRVWLPVRNRKLQAVLHEQHLNSLFNYSQVLRVNHIYIILPLNLWWKPVIPKYLGAGKIFDAVQATNVKNTVLWSGLLVTFLCGSSRIFCFKITCLLLFSVGGIRACCHSCLLAAGIPACQRFERNFQ